MTPTLLIVKTLFIKRDVYVLWYVKYQSSLCRRRLSTLVTEMSINETKRRSRVTFNLQILSGQSVLNNYQYRSISLSGTFAFVLCNLNFSYHPIIPNGTFCVSSDSAYPCFASFLPTLQSCCVSFLTGALYLHFTGP